MVNISHEILSTWFMNLLFRELVFWSGLFGLFLSFIVSYAGNFHTMISQWEIPANIDHLLIIGGIGTFAAWTCIQSFNEPRHKTAAASQIIFAYLVQIFLFHQVPGLFNMIGSALILFGLISIAFVDRQFYYEQIK